MKAVILAGGLGERMGSYTATTPKPMLPLAGRPILEHLVEWTRKAGIREIVLCVSHLRESIEGHFGDGSDFGVRIEYAATPRPMATAGQLRAASGLLNSAFVCMYGDSIFGHSLRAMVRQHVRTRPAMTIATHMHTTTVPYGVITTTRAGTVTSWDEKPRIESLINVGCYVIEPAVLALIPPNRALGMDSAVRRAIARGMRVREYRARGAFTDIGDIASYDRAQARLGGQDA